MKYLILVMLIVAGCTSETSTLNALNPPVVIVAKSNNNSTVTVCDSRNVYRTLHPDSGITNALHDSYEIGDTIIYLK